MLGSSPLLILDLGLDLLGELRVLSQDLRVCDVLERRLRGEHGELGLVADDVGLGLRDEAGDLRPKIGTGCHGLVSSHSATPQNNNTKRTAAPAHVGGTPGWQDGPKNNPSTSTTPHLRECGLLGGGDGGRVIVGRVLVLDGIVLQGGNSSRTVTEIQGGGEPEAQTG